MQLPYREALASISEIRACEDAQVCGIAPRTPLWSVLDVYRYYEPTILTAMLWLQIPAVHLSCGSINADEYKEQVSTGLSEAAKDLRRCHLDSLAQQAEQIIKSWVKPEVEVSVLIAMVSTFTGTVQGELSKHLFFRIPSDQRSFFEDIQLTPSAEKAFPSMVRDVKAAGHCFALDEPTACVLHLMRALEFPLSEMAKELGVTIANPNWHQVIKDCEDQIAALNHPTPNWKEDKEFFSGAALNFRYFKDAFRNHVSHGRHTYDKKEAYDILMHVAGFADHLSKRLSEV